MTIGAAILGLSLQTPLAYPALKDVVENHDNVTIHGTLVVNDEIIIYDSDEASKLELIYPYCVSGTAEDDVFVSAREVAGKKVIVRGTRHVFSELRASERGSIESNKELRGFSITNWCHGRYVIFIESIEVVQ